MPTITKFVEKRYLPNGEEVFSFRVDQYFRDKLAEVPDGAYLQLGPSQYAEGGYAIYWKERQAQDQPTPPN